MIRSILLEENTRDAWAKAYRILNATINNSETKESDTVRFQMQCKVSDIIGKTQSSVLYYFLSIAKSVKEKQLKFELSLLVESTLDQIDFEEIKEAINAQYRHYSGVQASVFIQLAVEIDLKNSRTEWIRAYENLNSLPTDNSELELSDNEFFAQIKMIVRFSVDCQDSDVGELKYFLPLRNYLERRNWGAELKTIGLDPFRKAAFLAQELSGKMNVDSKASDILPILTIPRGERQDSEVFDRVCEAYVRHVFSYNIDGDYSDLRSEKQRVEKKSNIKESIARERLLDIYQIIYHESPEEKKKYIDFVEESIKLEKKFHRKKKDNPEYKEEKDSLWNHNKSLFEDKKLKNFSDRDKFSILIFFFLLRQFISNKRAFIDDGKELVWNNSVIQKTIMDAKSYGEGLWQLIENAHEHSQGKVAFFGMRLHKANTDTTMSDFVKNAKTRENLWQKYWLTDSGDSNNIFNQRDESGSKLYPDFLEVFILDDALSTKGQGIGMLKATERDQKYLKSGHSPRSLSQIFELSEEDYAAGEQKRFFIKHYGMRWLLHHVSRHNGIVTIYSPPEIETGIPISPDTFCFHNHFKDRLEDWVKDKKIDQNHFATEYNILLPISYHAKAEKLNIQQKMGEYFDDIDSVFAKDSITCYHDLSSILEIVRLDISDTKVELAERLTKLFLEEAGTRNPCYIALPKDRFNTPYEIEILAKSIFLWIYKINTDNPGKSQTSDRTKQLKLAIHFGRNKDLIYEFVRIYSIFYLKQNESEYMDNVQIALCSAKEHKSGGSDKKTKVELGRSDEKHTSNVEINFILAGKNIETALLTANNFVYYNADSALEFVPLLRYLVNDTAAKTKRAVNHVPLYPFELIPKEEMGESWFLDQMRNRLYTNLWENKFGCRIPNVRVRLGSKIRINHFYEAELLFHNIGNIKRFAYLIAQDIINTTRNILEGTVTYIVGYEDYSAVLVQEVSKLLGNHWKDKPILWTLDTRSAGTFPVMDVPSYKDVTGGKNINRINVYTIVPIGSTMSTIYKLHESFKRGFYRIMPKKIDLEPSFIRNYAIIAIGNVFEKNNTDISEVASKYIDIKNPAEPMNQWKCITLKPECKGQEGVQVHYFLSAEAAWYDMKAEQEAGRDFLSRPLVHADKTSTLFNAFFQMELSQDALSYYHRADKSDNIKCLRPDIDKSHVTHFFRYAHIYREENHYQFYFDFKLIVEKHKEEIEHWLEKVFVEPDAYNVIISPLSESNAPFLKLVLDKCFGNSFHFLHIDINNSEKENVRTKFSYISDELRRMQSAYAKVNFYYVDEAVYAGKTIDRAAKLLLMICEQSDISLEKLRVNERHFAFKKVITLLNRSSYETAYQWVDNPTEDWVAFIDLAIPPYNMHAGTCPGCRIYNRFQLLLKRSATNELASFFANGVDKHSARTPEEYESYIRQKIHNNDAAYNNWLQSYRRWGRFPKSQTDEEECSVSQNGQLMLKAIAEDQYLRLYTMDRAYRKLVFNENLQLKFDGSNVKDIKEKILREILKLLCESFESKRHDGSEKNKYEQIMEFNSYLKVISREHLSRNYFVREAIYAVLHCILLLLIMPMPDMGEIEEFAKHLEECFKNDKSETGLYCGEMLKYWNGEEQYYRKIFENLRNMGEKKSIGADLQFRTFKIVIHRLALLHSDYIIRKDVVDQVLQAYEIMTEGKENKSNLKIDDLLTVYLASVKMASMAEDDDAMCRALYKLYQDMNTGGTYE